MTSSLDARLPSQAEISAEWCRRRLLQFVVRAWPILEPSTPFQRNWHIERICQHLEAVADGRIKNLLINVPPGHAKSLLVSVFWPCWMWLHRPGWRGLFASYVEDLAIRDSLKCRALISSEWYQGLLDTLDMEKVGGRWHLSGDQNVKGYFTNTATGFRWSTGVGAKASGYRGNCIVVDDPLNAKDQQSKAALKDVVFWWDQAYANRLNDLRHDARVVIMQRLHEEDLSGHLLEQGGWDYLMLPTKFDPKRRSITSLGVADPRTERDELLFPQRFPASVIAEEEARLMESGFAGQHQQSPVPEGGAMFKIDRIEIIEALPHDLEKTVRHWDAAGTPSGGDWTVGVRQSKTRSGLFIIEDVVRGQWGSEMVDRQMLNTAIEDGRGIEIGEEQEGGSAGKSVVASHTRMLAGWTYHGISETGDKETRAKPFAAQVNGGNVRLYKNPATGSPWIKAYLEELRLFPFGKHDDQVDASSSGFNKLTAGYGPARIVRVSGW